MDYFDGIKVGDRVYSVVYGWGTVICVSKDPLDNYQIRVMFDISQCTETYTSRGTFCKRVLQTLFWDDPHIIAPPRPKRKVKKTIGGWMNVYPSGNLSLYSTKETADRGANLDLRIACVRVTGEYEVEE